MKDKICIVYSHHKLGDLIWQLPYIKAISDHHQIKADLIIRSKTQGKKILCDTSYIGNIYYNEFRKSFYYWIEIIKIFFLLRKNNYTHIYFLDKINRPAIAAFFARIPNRIGLGIDKQKKWLTNKNFLNPVDKIYLDYSDQSKKFLDLNNIKITNLTPNFEINNETLNKINFPILTPRKNNICFGVDSFETYKIWKEENFAKLIDLLYEYNNSYNFFLISDPSRKEYSQKIISLTKSKNIQDCSKLDLLGVIKVIKNCKIYIGNNSGPLNLAAALGVDAFGLIAADSSDELKNSNIKSITPDDYNYNTFSRDKIIRDRSNMDKLTVEKVFLFIKNYL
jgi:heptosyltransferase-2